MMLHKRISAGKGTIKSDLALTGGMVVNVNTKELLRADIAVRDGIIVGLGDVSDKIGDDTEIIDITGKFVSPGLIDGHVHYESSMLTLTNFAGAAIRHGTTGMIIDPHEIANVLGKQGIELVLGEIEDLPSSVFVMIPSCVPSSSLETSGAVLDAPTVAQLLYQDGVIGLGEVMDFPGVLAADPEKLDMIEEALFLGKRADGHCPGMTGSDLAGYLCAGITSDHESLMYDEAIEKARMGMAVMLREGSAAKSLREFVPRLVRDGIGLGNFFFVSDDRHPEDLIAGYMDTHVRTAIELGIDPIEAISMCTINTARHYRIDHLIGSISIGRKADLVVLDDLHGFAINRVFVGGAANSAPKPMYPAEVFDTVRFKRIHPESLHLRSDTEVEANIIVAIPDVIFTDWRIETLHPKDGVLYPDPTRDILSIAVIERHGRGGGCGDCENRWDDGDRVSAEGIGRGFVSGFGIKGGAFAQSIAHDSHNVIVVGTNFEDMALSANEIRTMRGGIAVAYDGEIMGGIALPFAGLLSAGSVESVDAKLRGLHAMMQEIGCVLPSPFMTLSFLALPVVPRLKITDMGLVDIERQEIVSVCR
ncbi:MAG: adenine deaminase [Euryarchaeota archaeon]|nr:adenine deaminase [Euryarchaeota archaeon]